MRHIFSWDGDVHIVSCDKKQQTLLLVSGNEQVSSSPSLICTLSTDVEVDSEICALTFEMKQGMSSRC
eukprot:56707-Eustigmatos_ZCMA.PRE.1